MRLSQTHLTASLQVFLFLQEHETVLSRLDLLGAGLVQFLGEPHHLLLQTLHLSPQLLHPEALSGTLIPSCVG